MCLDGMAGGGHAVRRLPEGALALKSESLTWRRRLRFRLGRTRAVFPPSRLRNC